MYEPVQGVLLSSCRNGPIPSDLIDTMRIAFRLGRDSHSSETDNLPDLPDHFQKRLRPLTRGVQAAYKASCAAFHLGAARRLECGPQRSRVAHLANAQQTLTQALLLTPHTMRHVLFNEGHRIGFSDIKEWRATYAGAMAAARVAHVLLHVGLVVWLAPLGLDLYAKIDLLASFESTGQGLCLQIKGDNASAETICRAFAIDRAAQYAHEDPYLREFLRGVTDYDRRHSGVWQPMFVRVGSKNIPFHEMEDCQAVQRPLLEAVMRAIPSLARHLRVTGQPTVR